MPEASPDGHSAAMEYVKDVLGIREDLPASAGLSPSTEELSLLEESFFSQYLEKLIDSGGDRLLKELELVDDDSGSRFKIYLEILKLPADFMQEGMN